MKSVYVAHPLGAHPDGRIQNCHLAARWLAWAADQGVLPMATWITLATIWPESRKDEGFAIDFAQVELCDEVWLCGSHISPGMRLEIDHAEKCGIPVRDFTSSSGLPPVTISPS